MPGYAGHITWFPRVAGSPNEPATTPHSADCFAIACRAMDDMVILAHIREQHRLSLQRVGSGAEFRGGQQLHAVNLPAVLNRYHFVFQHMQPAIRVSDQHFLNP